MGILNLLRFICTIKGSFFSFFFFFFINEGSKHKGYIISLNSLVIRFYFIFHYFIPNIYKVKIVICIYIFCHQLFYIIDIFSLSLLRKKNNHR